jgi:hypothetical protein
MILGERRDKRQCQITDTYVVAPSKESAWPILPTARGVPVTFQYLPLFPLPDLSSISRGVVCEPDTSSPSNVHQLARPLERPRDIGRLISTLACTAGVGIHHNPSMTPMPEITSNDTGRGLRLASSLVFQQRIL